MKLLNVPIEIEPRQGQPQILRWQKQVFRVQEVIDYWVAQSRWWSKEERRLFLRLLTDRGTFEVYHSDGEWKLARIMD